MIDTKKRDTLAAQSMYVVKSNELIQRSRYSLSLMEQKAVLFLISKIKPNDEPNTEYLFDVKDFCRACNFYEDSGFYAKYVKDIMLSLADNKIVVDIDKGKTLITHWFSSAIIDNEANNIRIRFDYTITPYLFQLRSFYTQYSLEYVLPMKSKYGVRLYEFLRSVKTLNYIQTYSIEELRLRLDCDKYPNFKDFRKYVLEPAISDINAYSDIEVNYECVKTGRKYTAITFTIKNCSGDEKNMERFINRRKVLGEIR